MAVAPGQAGIRDQAQAVTHRGVAHDAHLPARYRKVITVFLPRLKGRRTSTTARADPVKSFPSIFQPKPRGVITGGVVTLR